MLYVTEVSTDHLCTCNYFFSILLVLAGMELNLFVVASMGLCFGFILNTVLVTQGCFGCCWAVLTQSQGLFCSSHRPASV